MSTNFLMKQSEVRQFVLEKPMGLIAGAMQCHRITTHLFCYSMSCKMCIIVGNGGILANKSLGQKIDGFDVVVRYVMTQKYYVSMYQKLDGS